MTPLLRAEAASFRYPDQDRLVVQDLSLSLEPGKLIQVAGRNGSGKTTSLRLLARELPPTSGRISTTPGTRSLYLDQKAAAILAPDLTIAEHLRAYVSDQRALQFNTDTKPFGLALGELVSKFAGQLSGGERQIFALLCALGGRYQFLLLDEFTSHLDEQSEVAANALLSEAIHTKRVGAVVVTHRPLALTADEKIEIGGD